MAARLCYRPEHLVAQLLLNGGEEHTLFEADMIAQRGTEIREAHLYGFRCLLDEAPQFGVLDANTFGQLGMAHGFDRGQKESLFDCKVRHDFQVEAPYYLAPYHPTSARFVVVGSA
ncbi:MAG TPA: hypothetical protein VJV79_09635 [Polyangiaceae bacterium]|jgi:hypothetical protein|nr:hypothetical protein [Polyangiaceae bacterium]